MAVSSDNLQQSRWLIARFNDSWINCDLIKSALKSQSSNTARVTVDNSTSRVKKNKSARMILQVAETPLSYHV